MSLEEYEEETEKAKKWLSNLGFTEYQAILLSYLILMGEGTASLLKEITGIPSAKIYETLNELATIGIIQVRTGRPAAYTALSPKRIMDNLIEYKQKTFDKEMNELKKIAKQFTKTLQPVYEKGLMEKRQKLLRIVKIGRASETETVSAIRRAQKEIDIISKVLEYLPRIIDELESSITRGVKVKILLLDPNKLNDESRAIQGSIKALLSSKFGEKITLRYAYSVPLRGTLIDPNDEGTAIFLAEEIGIPLFMREAAISENTNLVQALKLFFDLIWGHHSTEH
ncbi:MAG: TrmB family transcriptional regulator [Promethearchaeota archaeon]